MPFSKCPGSVKEAKRGAGQETFFSSRSLLKLSLKWKEALELREQSAMKEAFYLHYYGNPGHMGLLTTFASETEEQKF